MRLTGTRLSTRLDGFNVTDVEASIDRAQNAFIGPNNTPGGPFHFLVDNDPTKSYGAVMNNLVSNVLGPGGIAGHLRQHDRIYRFHDRPADGVREPRCEPGQHPAISSRHGFIYRQWIEHHAGQRRGLSHLGELQRRDLCRRAAITDFRAWLANGWPKGGTAATGNVQEPGASWSTVTNEDKMFQALLAGKTWAEAAWSATRQLSYVNTVVGDPLMIWRQLLAGDANMDGKVDLFDLTTIGAHWGNTVSPGGYGWYSGDLNGDGIVDVRDLAILGSTWGQISPWASQGPQAGGLIATPFSVLDDQSHATPEPSSCVLWALAIGVLVRLGYRRRRLPTTH